MKLMGRDQKTVFAAIFNNREPISIYQLECQLEGISYAAIRFVIQTLVERGCLEYVDNGTKVIALSPADVEFGNSTGPALDIPNQQARD